MLFEHLLEPGDRVVVEQPTYDRTLLMLQRLGVELVPVPLEADGLDVGGARSGACTRGRSSSPTSSPTSTTRPAARSRPRSGCGWSSWPPSTASGSSRTTPTASCPSRARRWRRCSRSTRPTASSTPPPSRRRSARACGSATSPGRGPRSPSSRSAPTRPTSHPTCWPSRSCSSSAAPVGSTATSSSSRVRCATRRDALVEALREQIPEAEFVVPGGGYFLWLDLAEGTDTHGPAGRGQGRGRRFRRRPRLHDRGRRATACASPSPASRRSGSPRASRASPALWSASAPARPPSPVPTERRRGLSGRSGRWRGPAARGSPPAAAAPGRRGPRPSRRRCGRPGGEPSAEAIVTPSSSELSTVPSRPGSRPASLR